MGKNSFINTIKHKRLLQPRNLLALLAFAFGFAFFMPAPETQATPVPCDGSGPQPVIAYNRHTWCGFFDNEGWTNGPALRGGTYSTNPSPGGSYTDPTAADPGIPDSVDTAQEFVDLILSDFYSSDPRAQTSARFIILSTLGEVPAPQATQSRTVTPAQIAEWQARVLTYADIGDENGTSTGQNGSITWSEEFHLACGEVNTYYQIDQDDVAPFLVNDTNTPDCNDPGFTEEYITFRDNDDNVLLRVRRICMNPAGEINPLAAAEPIPEDGTLGDKIFEDKDNDGVYEPNEGDEGISGVTVALYGVVNGTCTRDENQIIATTTTDADGNYQFTDLPIISEYGAFARYAVVVTDDANVLDGYTATQGEAGVNNNSQDPNGYCMTLAFDARSNQTGDFGYYRQEELAPTGMPTLLIATTAGGAVLAGAAMFGLHRRYSRVQ